MVPLLLLQFKPSYPTSATGKSALLRRLQGGNFLEAHNETPEIQTAHINWNYKVR
jgi:hypothetical protein